MDEIIKQLLGYARGMWKFRWPSLLLAWVVALIGVVFIYRIPDQYEASARIYVDTQSILKPLMAGLAVQPNVGQQISMLSRTLLSRPNLEKLVRMADLDLNVTAAADREELITKLGRTIQIRNTGRDNLYTLAIRDSDQEKAKRVVQSLTSMFVESSLGSSRKDTDSAKSFLDEQIRRYELKLEEAETRLKAFKVRNIDLQSPDGKDAASRVREAAGQLESVRLQLREAENARDSIRQQIAAERAQQGSAPVAAGSTPMPESSISVSTPQLDARIDALKRNLDGLLQRYTDQHPDVLVIRRQLQDLEQQKTQEMAELRKAALAAAAAAAASQGPAATTAGMVEQELSRMLASAEVQVATLRTRVGEFSARLAAARESLKTAPQLEAEAEQLNRDHGINRRNYEALVARRQSAVMAGELEVASGLAEFRLIDPPRVSPKPVSPNRVALLPLPLAAGLAAGLVLAFLLSQLRPVFYDPSELRNKTGLPLLGVVSLRVDDAVRRKERGSLIRFASASLGLVGLFAVGLAVTAAMS
ncbi:MAG: Wzz/FepE/Etk N-terminal domain-containing protein [Rubrivivax sp.]|nr:Wzz/FepE/Etk N-terminal domain-containing protein [Rubrivivax sp.]